MLNAPILYNHINNTTLHLINFVIDLAFYIKMLICTFTFGFGKLKHSEITKKITKTSDLRG